MTEPSPSRPDASIQNDPRLVAARQRLQRMEGFLQQDPSNNELLITAFEASLACGEWDKAQAHLRHAQGLDADPLGWRLREGDFWLAQQRYDEAQAVLEALLPTPNPPHGFLDVLMHNLAFIDLRRGDKGRSVERLASVLETSTPSSVTASESAGNPPVAARALQQLWSRALHQDAQLARAMAWALDAERRGSLDPQAAGVASLIAIDASDFDAAKRWSDLSLGSGDAAEHPAEAFVACASLALARQDAAMAGRFADAALQRHPGDGRALSTRGFAWLLAGELGEAFKAFKQALSVMGQHIGTWHGLAWTQIAQGDLAGAEESFQSALSLDRNFAESHGGLAVALAMQSRQGESSEHAELALRLDRSNASGRYAQALLSGEVKDASDVQRFARRILAGM
ncbi:tetratricopeptide (TPR) repeat protein [Pseudacidovorax sp. 1753]|uniref:tetratricopeptide repeat protein n=1 Tax=Pseudacidovorax sp. 1753 TaxID=3156419 RepID=UPI0033938CD9